MEENSAKNKISGAIISSRLVFAENRWGKSARQKLTSLLPLKEKKLAESPVFENSWFELASLEALDKTILEEFANGDTSILHELGKFSAEFNFWRLPTAVTEQKPEDLFKNASRINVLFQNFGEVEIEQLPDKGGIKQVALIYRYQHHVSENYCASGLGYFEKLLEQLGFSVIEIKETECQSKGAPVHRYEVSWIAKQLAEKLITKEDSYNSFKGTKELQMPTTKEIVPIDTVNSKSSKSEAESYVVTPIRVIGKESKFNWRIPALILLIVIVSFIGFVQWIFSPSIGNSNTADKIYNYNCVGELKITLRIDKPYLLLLSSEDLTGLTVSFEDKGKKYYFKSKTLPSNMLTEIGLGEFLGPDNKALTAELIPEVVSFTADVKEKKQDCVCKNAGGD